MICKNQSCNSKIKLGCVKCLKENHSTCKTENLIFIEDLLNK